ncbi:cache domain-containing protein [Methylobacterium phyllosphaerae]
MFKKQLTWPVLLVLTATYPVLGQRRPPPAHQASEVEALVNKAAEVLDDQGSKAFREFRRKGSPWRYADVYLFVMDMQGMVLLNAGNPNREGRNMLNERDADGKRFHKDFVDIVSNFGSGWVDYMFPRPNQAIPTVKWSYVCGTRVEGVEALVGAGVYVD